MDVKIGVTHSPRELVVDTTDSPDKVAHAARKAMEESDGVLEITDKRGRKVIVAGSQIAYVEIAEGDARRVGFAVGD